MKIRFRKFYILVESPGFVRWWGRVMAGMEYGDKALAVASFPFLFVKDEKNTASWVMNHEKIHLRQQMEFLIIGNILLWTIEYLYGRLFLGLSMFETYKRHAGEQEAYLNQNNPEYLKHRKLFAMVPYIFHKKKFSNNRETGEVEYKI